MSTSIDNKVVSMAFDNSKFESKVSQSISTLDKLKKSLNMDEASESFNNLEKTANKMDFSGLSEGVENVRLKFSALEVFAVTALANISNKVFQVGENIVSALTIDPIKTGFQEYETQINAVQTIFANTKSKGTSLDDINKALDELNTYADKTIYNFTEMTNNIGRFTAAGVDLDTSVEAIQGIANLAAVSGSSATQASTAMYQLSQALASGTVKLMDWNSVVNANMGGETFQNALKETAKQAGVNVDAIIKTAGSFRESLSKGWLTADILNTTLQKLTTSGANEYLAEYNTVSADAIAQMREEAVASDDTDAAFHAMAKTLAETSKLTEDQIYDILDLSQTAEEAATKVKTITQLWDTLKESAQSGWTQTWQLIIGDFEESRTFLSEVSDYFGNIISTASNARNSFLEAALSEKQEALQLTDWEIFMRNDSNVSGVEKAFQTVAESYGVNVDEIIEKNGSFFNSMREGWFTADMLRDVMEKYVDVEFDVAAETMRAEGFTMNETAAMLQLRNAMKDTDSELYQFVNLYTRETGRSLLLDSFWNIINNIGDITGTLKDAWRDVFPEASSEKLYQFILKFKEFTENAKLSEERLSKLKTTFKGVFSLLDLAKQAIVSIGKGISPIFNSAGPLLDTVLNLGEAFGNWAIGIHDTVDQMGVFDKVTSNIRKVVASFSFELNAVINNFSSLVDEMGGGFLGVLKAIGYSLVEMLDVISTIVINLFGINIYAEIEKIQKILRKVVDFVGNVLSGTFDVAAYIINSLGTAFGWCGDQVKSFGEKFEAPSFKNIISIFTAIGGAVKKIGLAIIEFAASGIERLSSALGGGDLTDKVLKLLEILFTGHIAAELTSLNKKVGDFGDILDKIADSMEMLQMKIKSESMMNYAKALLIFAGAMVILASIDADRLGAATGVVIELIVAMTAALAILDKFVARSTKAAVNLSSVTGKFNKLKAGFTNIGIFLSNTFSSVNEVLHAQAINLLTSSLTKFAAAILILAAAMWVISKIDADRVGQCFRQISVLAVEMVGTMKLLSGMKSFKAGGLIGMGVALVLIAAACKILSTMDTDMALGAMLGVDLFILSLSLAAKFLDSEYKTITKFGAQLLSISAAVLVLAGVAKILSTMSWEDLGKAGAGITTLITFMTASAKILDHSKHGFEQFGVELVQMSIALGIMALIGKLIATMSWEELGKAGAGILGCVVMLTSAAKVLDSDKEAITDFSKQMKSMAVAVAIMAAAAKIFATMSPEEFSMGLVGMAGSLWMLTQSLKACEGIQNGSNQLLVAAAAIMVLALAMKVFSSIAPLQVITSLVALAGVFAILYVGGTALKALSPILKELSVGLLVFGAALSVIGLGITLIATGISALALALTTGIGAIMGSLIIIVKGIGELIVAICQELTAILPAIKDLLKALIVTALQAVVETVSESVALLAELVPPIIEELVVLIPTLVDGIVNVIIKLLDSLTARIPELLTSVMNFLGTLLKAIVDACNAADPDGLLKIIEGFALVSTVIAMASSLAPLIPSAMLALVGIGAVIAEMALIIAAIGELNRIPGLQEMVASGGGLLQTIGTAIGQFVGGIIGGVAEGATSTLPSIGESLSNFMVNLSDFINGARSIDSKAIEGITALVGAILAITAADVIEGIVSWFTGKNAIDQFSEDVTTLGEGVCAFAESTKGINGAQVKNAACAGKMIAEMASALPNSGGLAGIFAGENDISKFAPQLKDFGKAIADFSAEVTGKVDESAVKSATNAGTLIADLANSLPNSGGLAGFFSGENDMSLFGEQLTAFGLAIADFSQCVTDAPISEEAITSASNAGKMLSDMANTLPNTGGLVSWFTGDNDIKGFGKQLVSFGKSLVDFSGTISGNIDEEAMTSAANVSTMLAQMSATLPNTGGLVSWFTGDTDIEEFGKQLIKLGTSLVQFNGIVAEQDFSASNVAIDALQKLLNMFYNANSFDPDGINLFINSFDSIANLSITSFCKAYTDSYTSTRTALGNFLATCISRIRAGYTSFQQAGSYLVSGFIIGMSDSNAMSRIRSAAADMANEAYTAAMKALDAHSPSKLFMKVGGYIPAGMAIGIDNMSDMVADSSESMAKAAINSTSSVISKLSEAINTDIDAEPTIRPVLDLTEIQNGSKSLSSIMGDKMVSIGATANIAKTVSSAMNTKAGSEGSTGQATSAVINYTQNNYSPKALSRIDIYRQTKNQLSGMKGLANA